MNLRTGFSGIGRRLDLFLYADFVPQAGAHVRSQVRLRCKEKLFDQDSCKKYKTKSKQVIGLFADAEERPTQKDLQPLALRLEGLAQFLSRGVSRCV